MNNIIIKPHKLIGKVSIPPSKSMAHRLIICACLAKGKCTIENISYSEDILATIYGMRALGAKITIFKDCLEIDGENFYFHKQTQIDRRIECNESGSTLRFLIPLSILLNNKVSFTGKGKLPRRPLEVYYKIFDEQKLKYKINSSEDFLELQGKLSPGEFCINGGISSQFISGLLLALPMLENDSIINIVGNLESEPYINLTIQAMKSFGVEIIKSDNRYIIKGNQTYKSYDQVVEGDYSQGAFFLVANALGSDIKILGLNPDSLQGDKEIVEIIERIKNAENLITIDGKNIPDIIPISALLACGLNKAVRFINVSRLKIKECDRLKGTCEILSKLGYNLYIDQEESLVISPGKKKEASASVKLDSLNDHRIAMLVGISTTVLENSIILTNSQVVKKSYPNFWEEFKALGGEYEQYMG